MSGGGGETLYFVSDFLSLPNNTDTPSTIWAGASVASLLRISLHWLPNQHTVIERLLLEAGTHGHTILALGHGE